MPTSSSFVGSGGVSLRAKAFELQPRVIERAYVSPPLATPQPVRTDPVRGSLWPRQARVIERGYVSTSV